VIDESALVGRLAGTFAEKPLERGQRAREANRHDRRGPRDHRDVRPQQARPLPDQQAADGDEHYEREVGDHDQVGQYPVEHEQRLLDGPRSILAPLGRGAAPFATSESDPLSGMAGSR
jgi:hypothetical protein